LLAKVAMCTLAMAYATAEELLPMPCLMPYDCLLVLPGETAPYSKRWTNMATKGINDKQHDNMTMSLRNVQ
jgi:hypothetical protein